MHPTLRKGPLFYKTPPFSTFFHKKILPFSTFLTKYPTFQAYGREMLITKQIRRCHHRLICHLRVLVQPNTVSQKTRH